MKARIDRIDSDLYLITLNPPLKGFDDFIGAWVYTGSPAVVVDVGPAASASSLIDALDDLGVNRLDYILLTHIHIDHAGGIGEMSARFPDTPVICHESGLAHLADPAKLWAGSLKTLGNVARAYGEITSVPLERLQGAGKLRSAGVEVLMTPGHAPHHVSYRIDKFLFAGEAGGVCLKPDPSTIYMRPATPPRFFMETAVNSLDALIQSGSRVICYGHFGVGDDAPALLKEHRAQLFQWETLIREEMMRYPEEKRIDACLKRLVESDPLLAAFREMPGAIQARERGFLINSIRGYLGYLETRM